MNLTQCEEAIPPQNGLEDPKYFVTDKKNLNFWDEPAEGIMGQRNNPYFARVRCRNNFEI